MNIRDIAIKHPPRNCNTRAYQLRAMEAVNNKLQTKTETGSAAWHRHETIDDMIHDLLTMEGE